MQKTHQGNNCQIKQEAYIIMVTHNTWEKLVKTVLVAEYRDVLVLQPK